MFRFWASDSRGSDGAVAAPQPIADLVKPQHSAVLPDTIATITSSDVRPPKRRRQSFAEDSADSLSCDQPAKKSRTETHSPSDVSMSCDATAHLSPTTTSARERACDEIRHQFGLEILLKHDELRLINQELAKCQIALEQLRRCHLIPYPTSCPTPDQMLNVSAGKGPALQRRPGEPIPRWAPPFGVVEGPYARHYAKWLIPDPSFDGVQPEWQFTPEAARARASFAEGRTTRNSFAEPSSLKGRPMRGTAGQKLQSLSSGYPQPKEKAGPCILKRADGKTVKLVCIDCNRENFSSTQGFINHCRIAHKRDFKSHEEAAVQSGHPIEVSEKSLDKTPSAPASAPAPEERVVTTNSGSALVHPFARPEMTEQQAFVALQSRIADSMKLYREGKLPGVTCIPSTASVKEAVKDKAKKFAESSHVPETPFLSQLMRKRNFKGNLRDLVSDARTKVSLDDMTPGAGDESEGIDTPPAVMADLKGVSTARTPVVMRVPARSTKSPAPAEAVRPASSKGRAPHLEFVTPPNSVLDIATKNDSNHALSDEDIDMDDADMSPNTMISNNAPSLVSDDGEYDDSDDGSSVSGVCDNLDAESVSDVAEITLDDEPEPRSLHRGSSGASGAVRLHKDDSKHVTFMSPVKSNANDRRRHHNL